VGKAMEEGKESMAISLFRNQHNFMRQVGYDVRDQTILAQRLSSSRRLR
jgi:hypothetical protein